MDDDKFNFLTGRVNNDLVSLGDFQVHTELTLPWQKLQSLAKKEMGADLQLISS